MALGDSKSAPDTQIWAYILANAITGSQNVSYRAIEMGRGGYTVVKTLANITTDSDNYQSSILNDVIAHCQVATSNLDRCQQALGAEQPPYVFINLGANDVGFVAPWVLPNQTTWQNNYLSIIDAIHTQWPSALVYVTKPWKTQSGGDDTMWDTIAGWVDNVVAARTFTRAGDDERAWFKPNAATYSDDGIHFNAAGQVAAAAAKKTATGL